MASDGNGATPFRRERAYGGLALIGLAIVLALIDAFSADFELNPIELGFILGAGMLLLGVEAGRFFLGR